MLGQRDVISRECFILSQIMPLGSCRDWLQFFVNCKDFDIIDFQIVGTFSDAQVMLRVETSEEFYMRNPQYFNTDFE